MTSQSHMNQGPEDEREQEARRIVQICAIPDTEDAHESVIALDNRGEVWCIANCVDGTWTKLPPLPES